MTLLFGAVAAMYDEARPGYPPAILDAVTAYHGGMVTTDLRTTLVLARRRP